MIFGAVQLNYLWHSSRISMAIQSFHFPKVGRSLYAKIQHKIDFITKPLGVLGRLKKLSNQIGRSQGIDSPILSSPSIVVFAGDYRIALDEVSTFPQAVTISIGNEFS